MKNLPDAFLVLNHEGLHKVTMTIEPIQPFDQILATFGQEKLLISHNIADHPYGMIHQVLWTSEPTRYMTILELTRGTMVLDTQYQGHSVTTPVEQNWVSPCFLKFENSFPLRCAFEFSKWCAAGLRMFLALAHSTAHIHLWVYYDGQIYHLPFGNIFEGTEQICLGQNTKPHADIFRPNHSKALGLTKAMELLSASVWNHDTFNAPRSTPILNSLVRFNSDSSSGVELAMMDPLDPAIIKKSVVATSKDLVQITQRLIPTPILQS
jgi:hypothetical protein